MAWGLEERGFLASRLLGYLGPLWFSLEYLVVQALAFVLYDRFRRRGLGLLGVAVAITGPWLAGWANLFLLVLLLG